jgi:hypothetical protein
MSYEARLKSPRRSRDKFFFVKAIDNGEPGTTDIFETRIWVPGVTPEGKPTERTGGALRGGNIVVHTK